MNLQTLQIVKPFTKRRVALLVVSFLVPFLGHVKVHAWEVDFSRRAADLQKQRQPASVPVESPRVVTPPVSREEGVAVSDAAGPLQAVQGWIGGILETTGPKQEFVVLHTDKGFVPSVLRVRRGQTVEIHVVNIDREAKNISFVLEAFQENHGTFYGLNRSFSITPKVEGVFPFVSPETGRRGQLIVVEDRRPASSGQ